LLLAEDVVAHGEDARRRVHDDIPYLARPMEAVCTLHIYMLENVMEPLMPLTTAKDDFPVVERAINAAP